MTSKHHPYRNRPNSAYWRRAVAQQAPGELDPGAINAFKIGKQQRVATAGSCFAQHIGRYLSATGSNLLVTERAHPLLTPEAASRCSYGLFSARFGNIYTARQLLQLWERAFGEFDPAESVWREGERSFLDPFRPGIQPGGFNSERELLLDRRSHLAAVRQMFERLDVFVFTLGLTEAWLTRADDAVLPVCPGVAGGEYSAQRYKFVNFGVGDVFDDMQKFVAKLQKVNPRARIVLTVSPVPLAATAEDRHVLVATSYSKSVLRVACEFLVRQFTHVAYFPAFEIISSGHAGHYFAEDRRTVLEVGIAHVMGMFARHFMADTPRDALLARARQAFAAIRSHEHKRADDPVAALEHAFRAICDEEALDRPFD